VVKLLNLLRRPRVFNLERAHFTESTGLNGIGEPESVTLLARETVEVHPEVLLCREVEAALRPPSGGRPTLRVVK